MDAPSVETVNQLATKGAPELDASSARSRSSSGANPDEHEKDYRDDDQDTAGSDDIDEEEEEDEDDEDSDEDDEEPRLKYAYLTKHLGSVYRNGDATSTFLVAGDKMVSPSLGTPRKMN